MLSLQEKMGSDNNNNIVVINPSVVSSVFCIPNCPEYISIDQIHKMNNISQLIKLEYKYDQFIKQRFQTIQLVGMTNINMIDELFDIRDHLIIRINAIRRVFMQYKMINEYG